MSLPLGAEKEDRCSRPDIPPLCNHHDEVAEKIEVDCPEIQPVDRIAAWTMEIAFGMLLYAGLAALWNAHLKLHLRLR
jgi:hypothetical protein